ncbi:hypothetical protein Lumi_107 [Xylophilus phage Lumi]|nr:hypothetical protein Lumi_107 [Xylophilus phage Lumi]
MVDKLLPPNGRTIITPAPGGWKPNTVYLVLVSWHHANPKHECILHTGFINEDGSFGGYCLCFHHSYEYPLDADRAVYMCFRQELCELK